MSAREGSTIHRSGAGIFLWLSLPIALLAMSASAAGVLLDSTYAAESPNWAAQAVGQDWVNLLFAYPLLLILAWRAARGSAAAYLLWLGVLAYSAYSYVLYAGYTHFGVWFPAYVAVLGLSAWALAGGTALLEPRRVRAAFAEGAPRRFVGAVLVALGTLFALLWASEITRALRAGGPLPAAEIAGLPTNPVYMLDLAFVLPAMVLTGVLLLRRRAPGYAFAAPLLTFGVVMGVAILGMFVLLDSRGEPVPAVAAVLMGAVVLVEAAALAALLRRLEPALLLRGGGDL